jgi:hypothetical protein
MAFRALFILALCILLGVVACSGALLLGFLISKVTPLSIFEGSLIGIGGIASASLAYAVCVLSMVFLVKGAVFSTTGGKKL